MQFDGTVATFEDKVAQRAIAMLLEPIYEQDFLPCSYGFRPGRSAHDALHALRTAFMTQGLRWVLDIDIVKYFDSISHSNLRSFLDQRVTDGVVRRVIDKWLKAGVLEDGTTSRVRYADDAVMAFEDHLAAKRALAALGKRLGRYGGRGRCAGPRCSRSGPRP